MGEVLTHRFLDTPTKRNHTAFVAEIPGKHSIEAQAARIAAKRRMLVNAGIAGYIGAERERYGPERAIDRTHQFKELYPQPENGDVVSLHDGRRTTRRMIRDIGAQISEWGINPENALPVLAALAERPETLPITLSAMRRSENFVGFTNKLKAARDEQARQHE